MDQIAASIAANGFVNPILANPAGVVVAGHGRLRAARQLRLTTVPTIVVRGLSEAEERRIADNTIALNAGWDADPLRLELAEIDIAGLDHELTGFSVAELDIPRDIKIDNDERIDPVPVEAVSRLGDI